jgi:hypothetical protein
MLRHFLSHSRLLLSNKRAIMSVYHYWLAAKRADGNMCLRPWCGSAGPYSFAGDTQCMVSALESPAVDWSASFAVVAGCGVVCQMGSFGPLDFFPLCTLSTGGGCRNFERRQTRRLPVPRLRPFSMCFVLFLVLSLLLSLFLFLLGHPPSSVGLGSFALFDGRMLP